MISNIKVVSTSFLTNVVLPIFEQMTRTDLFLKCSGRINKSALNTLNLPSKYEEKFNNHLTPE